MSGRGGPKGGGKASESVGPWGKPAMLLDVNVLVALAWPNHVHHVAARAWFNDVGQKRFATCPVTQSGFVRVSSNRTCHPARAHAARGVHSVAPDREAARARVLDRRDRSFGHRAHRVGAAGQPFAGHGRASSGHCASPWRQARHLRSRDLEPRFRGRAHSRTVTGVMASARQRRCTHPARRNQR